MDQNRILFHVQITCVGHKYLVQIGSVMDIVSREETTDCKCSIKHNFQQHVRKQDLFCISFTLSWLKTVF